MINEEIFPVMDSINLATKEDAQKLSKILNELFEENTRIRRELEGQWLHIRNLEEKLLAPSEHNEWAQKQINYNTDAIQSICNKFGRE